MIKKLIIWEQLGKIGHREIARTWSACGKTLVAAGGAGLVTAMTAMLKYLISHGSFALVTAAILGAVNFVLSFLLIQGAGLRLATKQSTLFGAALGSRARSLGMHIRTTVGSYYAIDREVGFSLRTQVMSAIGNLAIVMPAGFVMHRLMRQSALDPLPSAEAAQAVLQSLNPLRADTLAYACLTGGLLWFCTWAGGAIASRTNLFTKARVSLVFNVMLGILLAAVPFVGKALHAPLDVRHFALSGGALGMATSSLGLQSALAAGAVSAIVGVIVIGFLNFGVSFVLAFASASLQSPARLEPTPA